MKSLLVTAVITTFVLALFLHSGYALRCYSCEQSPFRCRSNVTCSEEEDACLQIRTVNLRTYRCWKMSRCGSDAIAEEFGINNFKYLCCTRDFCNKRFLQ